MQRTQPTARLSLNGRTTGTLIIVGLLVIGALVALANSYTVVQAGTRGVVTTFGQITGVLDEGLHFRTPFISNVTFVDVKTQRQEANASAASRDLQIVTTQVVLNYRPDAGSVASLIQTVGTDYVTKVVDPALQESVKAATARFTAEELITQRALVSESIQQNLVERLQPRGVIVEELSITEFNFSPEFSQAIEAKQVAEQDALRAERELRRAQIEAQQQVARAEADAEARLKVAQAEAEALRLQREVISDDLLQLRLIEKWDGVLPRFNAGGEGAAPLIQLPFEETPADQAAGEAPAPAASQAPAPAPATAQPTATPGS